MMNNTNTVSHFTAGSIVRLPDGSIGTLTWSDADEAHVVHRDVLARGGVGAGPWIFPAEQLGRPDLSERAKYIAACGGPAAAASI